MLPCGHSFCSDCLQLLFKPSKSSLSCPSCLQEVRLAPADLDHKNISQNFTKNFALIALADSEQSREPLLQMKLSLGLKQSKLYRSSLGKRHRTYLIRI